MPPRPQARKPLARSRGSDPTVSISTAAIAKFNPAKSEIQEQVPQPANIDPKQGSNEDLKKLIETLKNKLGNTNATPQKKAPPSPQARNIWNRSIAPKEKSWSAKPAYTVLTRISNHEKVPAKSTKQTDLTINAVPHAFLYRPGVDGIKVGKLNIQSGKQLGIG